MKRPSIGRACGHCVSTFGIPGFAGPGLVVLLGLTLALPSLALVAVPSIPAGAAVDEPTITPGIAIIDSIDDGADQPARLDAAAIEELLGERTEGENPPGDQRQGAQIEGDTSSIRVCFGPGIPADVQSIARNAAATWSQVLRLEGPTIEVDFFWVPFASPRSLGAAGPGSFVQDSRLPDPSSRYPVALANVLLDRDFAPRAPCDLSRDPEVLLLLNQSAGGSEEFWHTGVSAPPSGKLDLASVVLHELGHGLGFLGSPELKSDGAIGWPPDGEAPFIFDRFAGLCVAESNLGCDAFRPLAIGEIGPLTQGAVWFDLAARLDLELYAPGRWERGSSFAHLDESRYRSEFSLMTPFLAHGEEQRKVDNGAAAVLQQLGYSIDRRPAPLLGGTAVVGDRRITVRVDPAPLSRGLPPVAVEIELFDGRRASTTIARMGEVVITGLGNGTTYRVRARGGNDAGRTDWITISDAVTPLALPPFATDDAFVQFVGDAVLRKSPSPSERSNLIARARVVGASTVIAELLESARLQSQMQVLRLYRGIHQRPADLEGFRFWTERAEAGMRMGSIARFFAASAEFTDRQEVSDSQLVDELYRRVLGRNPDAVGRSFWLAQLGAGLDRGQFVLAMTDSTEFRAVIDDTAAADAIGLGLLGRLPTAEERVTWTTLRSRGGLVPVIDAVLDLLLRLPGADRTAAR